jgi:hypothetical protein
MISSKVKRAESSVSLKQVDTQEKEQSVEPVIGGQEDKPKKKF